MLVFPRPAAQVTTPKVITLSDGQTMTVVVIDRPSYQQRFNDEGREIQAFSGREADAWANYRLGRIRDAVVDWQDVTNDKGQPMPYSFQRLLQLMEAAPETVDQLASIANEVFRPLVPPAAKLPPPFEDSGDAATNQVQTPEQDQQSDSGVNSDPSEDSQRHSE